MRLRLRVVAVIVLAFFIGSIFEPIVAYAKNTPDWWPYWETAKHRKDCPVDDGTHWHAKYCNCWFPLGWAFEPILYKSEKDWRNSQWERYWKWWSRIRMNYDAMIKTKTDEVINFSEAEKILQQSDTLLRAAHALSVDGNFDSAFDVYFPNYVNFAPAEVEELRLLTQWIALETEWIKTIAKSGQNYATEQKELERLNKLLWENKNAIATADDVLAEIIGFGLGGAAQWILDAFKTMLDAMKNIEQFLDQIKEALGPIVTAVENLVKTMQDVANQIKDKINGIKETINDALKNIPFGIGDKLADFVNNMINPDEIMGEFSDMLGNSVGDIIKNMTDSIKAIRDFDFESLGGDWIKLVKQVVETFQSWMSTIENILKGLDPLKAYKYGQTQALQAAGSMAGHMALVANRTDRELNGFVEIHLTAEHTRRTRKAAVRNNMVIAGKKAQSAPSGKKVKLGFN